eukprot:scaffold5.g609.t1
MASADALAAQHRLLAFLRPDETAAELLARTYVEPLLTGVPLVDRHAPLRAGHVLEVAGGAGSGKTDVLVQAAATCILPAHWEGVVCGGRAGHVLLFDLDGKFDIMRLHQVLEGRLQAAVAAARRHSNGAQRDRFLDATISDSVARLFVASRAHERRASPASALACAPPQSLLLVLLLAPGCVRCHSSFEYLAALRAAAPLLRGIQGRGGRLSALMIDNVAAHYSVDKAARGAAATGSGAGAPGGAGAAALVASLLRPWGAGGAPAPEGDITKGGAPLALARVHAAAAAELRALQQEFRVPVIASRHAVQAAARQADRPDAWDMHDPVMPRPWLELVTHRLLLKAVPAAALEPGGQGGAARDGEAEEGAEGPAAPPAHLARWQEEEGGAPVRFAITRAAIHIL